MKKNQRSRTADAAAAARASHLLYDNPILFEDPLALPLTSPVWRRLCRSRALHWLVYRTLMAPFRPIQGQVLSRARYAEDKLEDAISSGIDQYVIIGAGLDSFAWRRKDLSSSVQVFELDHPESQACKLRRLSKAGIDTPQGLHFIPIDFERQALLEILSVSAFLLEKPAFFSWLGVTYYLTEKSVMSTLSAISSFAAKGSQIVFDYGIHRELMGTSAVKVVKKVRRFTSRRMEKLITTFDPNEFPARVCELGFKLLENLSPSEQNVRYFAERTDDLCSIPVTYYAHFEVSS